MGKVRDRGLELTTSPRHECAPPTRCVALKRERYKPRTDVLVMVLECDGERNEELVCNRERNDNGVKKQKGHEEQTKEP